jgi:D-alanyl-D-alanine carboxypeptidase
MQREVIMQRILGPALVLALAVPVVAPASGAATPRHATPPDAAAPPNAAAPSEAVSPRAAAAPSDPALPSNAAPPSDVAAPSSPAPPAPPTAPSAGGEEETTADDADLVARLDAYFGRLAAAGAFGGVVLVGDGERVRALRAYGVADAELGVPMAAEHRFRIASLTKTFTAAAILVLRDRGVLTLDDPLERWLPGLPAGGATTLRHLLRHESGIGDPEVDADAADLDPAALVAAIAAAPRHFAPGEGNRYSNAGYALLARVVERASGLPFDDFLQRTLFAPLGMAATGAAGRWSLVEGAAEGYLPGPPPTGLARAPRPRPDLAFGSGHLWSTAGDLWRWARAVDAATLVDVDSGDWPYGWGRIRTEGRQGIDQTGLTDGFTASLALHRAADLYVVVLGNVMTTDWTRWAADASAIAFGEAPEPAVPEPPAPLAPERLAPWLGTYRPAAGGERSLSVVLRDGHAWLEWTGRPPGHFLAPRADGRFAVRGECGTVRFERAAAKERLLWACGDGETVFERPGPPR